MKVLRSLIQTGLALTMPPAAPDGDPDAPRGDEHRFSGHTPLWAYVPPRLARPWADQDVPLFEILAPDTPAAEAARRTNLLVFVGAARTPLLESALARDDACALVFEPDPERLARLAEDLGTKTLARANCHLFGGDTAQARPPLLRILEGLLRRTGYPVFFVQAGLERSHPGYLDRLIRDLEIGFYRFRVYGVEGQTLSRSYPMRDIARGLFYDQQKHLYENLPEMASWPDITAVQGAFPDATAILVGAGPDLPERLEWIRDNAGRALVIAISRTALELAEAGIEPHFVVINDTSVAAEKPMTGLPDMGRTILAAHCLSPLGRQAFRRMALFGTALPELFGQRPMLRLHGSVLTTAFSLARWLGCARAVLVGAQMASDDPWSFAYSAKSAMGRDDDSGAGGKPLTYRHPQLVPVTAASGRSMYTSLNFLDATLWFLDEIAETGLEVVNTSADSIVHGPGVIVDEDYRVPAGEDVEAAFAALRLEPRATLPKGLRAYVKSETANWRNTARAADNVLSGLDTPGGLAAAARLIEIFDANNTTYLTQRFRKFENARFHDLYFVSGSETDRRKGAAYMLRTARDMALSLVDVLAETRTRLKGRDES